jgi:hypothetical protein
LLQLAVFSTRVCSTMGGDTNETGYAYVFLLILSLVCCSIYT